MRTNIIIDDGLISRAKELSGLRTKRAIVHEALQLMVQMYEQKQVRELRGELHWEGDLDQIREGRFEYSG